MRETMKQLHRLLKLPGARKQPYVVKSNDELMVAANGFGKSALCPIFCISSVDGTNVPLLRQFFNLMPSRRAWAAQDKLPTEFLIDQYFNVPGVGLVVAGTLLSGAVHVNHELLMGPNNQGKFNKVTIKSIHLWVTPHIPPISHPAPPTSSPGDDQVHPPHAQPRPRAAPRPDRRVRRALAHQGARPPVRHPEGDGPPRRGGLPRRHSRLLVRCPRPPLSDDDAGELPADPVRAQRAAVRPHLRDGQGGAAHRYVGTRLGRGASHARRHSSPQLSPPAPPSTGVRARVTFEFMYRPEFLQPGTKVLFTEGKTKAIGTIVELLGAAAEEKPAAPRSTAHGHGGQGTGAGASKERKSGEADASRQ